jgi:hypothetical protein
MPVLKKKFVRFSAYGKATIEDVFSSGDLKQAQQYEAKTFASSWFENKNGNFVAHVLAAEAQVSPVNQVITDDFNGDGNLDLLLVGNSYSPDVETGRYDAGNGLLLTGDGKGAWVPLPARQTGFWATKEARDAAQLKLANGKTLFLVANNSDVLQGFVK